MLIIVTLLINLNVHMYELNILDEVARKKKCITRSK